MKQWHLLAIAGILGIIILFSPMAESAIPPTRAWLRILTDTGNVTANSYAANLTLTGDGITITPFFANNTLRFTSGVSSLAMEDLSNVTDSGCAVGQARTVNASGWYVCSNVGTGDITGAANVGTGTGTVFRDEVLGTLNFKTIKEGANISIINNADDITITAAAGASGYTKINNLDGGTAKILATNITNQATVKTLTAGTGISITNGSKTITINATGSSVKIDNQTAQPDRFLTGFNNVTGDWTTKIFSVDNQTQNKKQFIQGINNVTGAITRLQFGVNNQTYVKGDIQIIGINNVTGVIRTNQFSVNTQSCSAGKMIQSIDNVTGNVVCATVTASGGANSLAANVTLAGSPSQDVNIWTIPLTANSGNTIRGVINAFTSVSGTAPRGAANLTAPSNAEGYCMWIQVSTTTANAIDNLVLNTVLTGRATNTGETAWIAAANRPMPIIFDCTIKAGASPGNLKIWLTPELSGATIGAKAGSLYIKTP